MAKNKDRQTPTDPSRREFLGTTATASVLGALAASTSQLVLANLLGHRGIEDVLFSMAGFGGCTLMITLFSDRPLITPAAILGSVLVAACFPAYAIPIAFGGSSLGLILANSMQLIRSFRGRHSRLANEALTPKQ